MRAAHGQIWTMTFSPTTANEQAGDRPCIVISANRFNALPIEHAIVVPLTTRRRDLPHHVPVVDSDGGLDRASWAMTEAIRSVSTRRFGRLIGNASNDTLGAIERCVRLWFGFR